MKTSALIPTEKGLLAETLFFFNEVKEIPKESAHPELNDAELTMAKTLINSMVKEFEPELYHDAYQARLREIIEAKINNKEISNVPDEQPANLINLQEALEESLKQINGGAPKKRRTTRKRLKRHEPFDEKHVDPMLIGSSSGPFDNDGFCL